MAHTSDKAPGSAVRRGFVMYKCLVVAIAVTLAGPAEPEYHEILRVPIDIHAWFGTASSAGESGYVVIDTVTLNRTQPSRSGNPVTVSPEYTDTQIGWADGSRWGYLILLEGNDIEGLVRDALTEGFSRAGYSVVGEDHSRATNAQRVNVEVSSLWTWVVPRGRIVSTFYFNIETIITSESGDLASVGRVSGNGSLSGNRSTAWQSYRNTVRHSILSFIENVTDSVKTSVLIHMNGENAVGGSAIDSLLETLKELARLRDSGAITEDEFDRLKKMAIEDADR